MTQLPHSITSAAEPPESSAPDSETRARILEAARQVFVRHGTAGARMQEIAADAGVNQALLHYYFGTKEALAEAVFREAAVSLFPVLMKILGGTEPLEVRVERVVHHYIDTLRRHPFLPGYVLAEMNFRPERLEKLLLAMSGTGGKDAIQTARLSLQKEIDRKHALGESRPMAADQFLVSMASLCVFPFAARPMLAALLHMDDAGWQLFLDARRRELPGFILSALRP